ETSRRDFSKSAVVDSPRPLASVALCANGQGPRLSARIVDDASVGALCARARGGRGTRMSRQSCPRHGVQDSRSRGSQTIQGALLSGTPRCRVRAEDGGGSVRLSRGPGPEKGRGQGEENVKQIAQTDGDRLLRREARYPGDRYYITGFATGTRHLRDVLARSRV